jgi:hypothetical protein
LAKAKLSQVIFSTTVIEARMTGEIFYEVYDKLSKARTVAERVEAINALAQACRANEDKQNKRDERFARAKICIHQIAQSKELFATAIATYIVQDDDVPLAKALAHEASVVGMKLQAAEHYDLTMLSEEASILAACRLCSIYVTPAISLGWTLSLLTSYLNSDNAKRAADHLVEYHVTEFPRTTLRLLAAAESVFTGVALAEEALNFLRNEMEYLESLPKLREFTMTPEMRLTLGIIRRRQNRDIQDHARQKSVFMQICKVEHFKYANRTSVEFGAGAQTKETTMEMSPYSLEVELPISEYTDPMAGAGRRGRLWKGVPG